MADTETEYSAACPLDILGRERKPTARSCGWTTSGWSTRSQADARLAQHLEEHETGEPMPELIEFLGTNESEA